LIIYSLEKRSLKVIKGSKEETMKILILAAAFSLFSLTTGCATVVEGNKQALSVTTEGCDSNPESSARCHIQNKDNDVYVDAPGTVNIEKGKTDLAVNCSSSDGSAKGHAILESTYEAMNAGNILLGGGIGLIVDAASGAMWKYPKTISVPMKCGEDPSEASDDIEVTDEDAPSTDLEDSSEL